MDRSEKFNKIFNAFILIGMAVVTVLVLAVKLRDAEDGRALLVIAALGSLAGVLATVLSANGRILNFLFGLIDVTIYGAMCLTGAKYGNAALHLLYFLPMQAVGFVQWKKRGAGEHARVRARRLDGRGWLIAGSIFLAGSVAAYFILSALDKTEAAGVVRCMEGWLLNTQTDMLIRLMPTPFFVSMGCRLLLAVLAVTAVCCTSAVIVRKLNEEEDIMEETSACEAVQDAE